MAESRSGGVKVPAVAASPLTTNDLYSDLLHDGDDGIKSGGGGVGGPASVDAMLPDDGPAVANGVAQSVVDTVRQSLDVADCGGPGPGPTAASAHNGDSMDFDGGLAYAPSPLSVEEERRALHTPGVEQPADGGTGAAVAQTSAAPGVDCANGNSSTRVSLAGSRSDDDEPVPPTPSGPSTQPKEHCVTSPTSTIGQQQGQHEQQYRSQQPSSILDDYFVDAQHLSNGPCSGGEPFGLRSPPPPALLFDDDAPPQLPSLHSSHGGGAIGGGGGGVWQNRVASDVLSEVQQGNSAAGPCQPQVKHQPGAVHNGGGGIGCNPGSCRTPPAVLPGAQRWMAPCATAAAGGAQHQHALVSQQQQQAQAQQRLTMAHRAAAAAAASGRPHMLYRHPGGLLVQQRFLPPLYLHTAGYGGHQQHPVGYLSS